MGLDDGALVGTDVGSSVDIEVCSVVELVGSLVDVIELDGLGIEEELLTGVLVSLVGNEVGSLVISLVVVVLSLVVVIVELDEIICPEVG